MSEIAQDGGGGGKKGGKIRSKKSSTRIDMTPMVDLAFLLLTFFILTTTLQKPQAMQITMPEKDDKEPPKVNEKHVLTLIMGKDNKIYYYMGITDPEIKITNFSKEGVRKLLLSKKASIPKLIVLIKSLDESKYKNMVDILDEMNINNIERYAIVDPTTTDKDLIKESHL
jgi:biopolymer transport protein ExbD